MGQDVSSLILGVRSVFETEELDGGSADVSYFCKRVTWTAAKFDARCHFVFFAHARNELELAVAHHAATCLQFGLDVLKALVRCKSLAHWNVR